MWRTLPFPWSFSAGAAAIDVPPTGAATLGVVTELQYQNDAAPLGGIFRGRIWLSDPWAWLRSRQPVRLFG